MPLPTILVDIKCSHWGRPTNNFPLVFSRSRGNNRVTKLHACVRGYITTSRFGEDGGRSRRVNCTCSMVARHGRSRARLVRLPRRASLVARHFYYHRSSLLVIVRSPSIVARCSLSLVVARRSSIVARRSSLCIVARCYSSSIVVDCRSLLLVATIAYFQTSNFQFCRFCP